MQSNYYSTYSCINIYEQPSIKSKISSQIIYGEKFKVLRKIKNFLKIRTSYDRYNGYIKNKNFIKKFIPTHKVKALKAKIYKSDNFLPFSSEIEIVKKKKRELGTLLSTAYTQLFMSTVMLILSCQNGEDLPLTTSFNTLDL